MALSRDQQRLVKMDVYILDLQYLYERELQHEIEIKKHNLLLSRGIKYRLDKARRARALLNQSIGDKLSRKNTYAIELSARKLEVERAEEEVDRLATDIVTKLGQLTIAKQMQIECSALEFEYNQLIREMPRQRTRVRNKERALQNWLLNGEVAALRLSRDKMPKKYETEKDVDAIYGQLGDDPVMSAILNHSNYDIRKSPNFHEKPVTNITIDMITRPEDMHLFEVDKNANEVVEVQERLTSEQIEERTLAEMHNTKYSIVMID